MVDGAEVEPRIFTSITLRPATTEERADHHKWLRDRLGRVLSRVYVPDLLADPGVLYVCQDGVAVAALVYEHEFREPRPVTPSGDDDDDQYWAAKCGGECTSAVFVTWAGQQEPTSVGDQCEPTSVVVGN
jgi:hypothetical protein